MEKLINFIIKNIVVILSFILISFIGFYKIAPSLFKSLLYIGGVNIEIINMAEQVENNEILINELSEKIKLLEYEKTNLENELSKSISSKEGLIEGIKKIKFEQTNWFLIIGVTIFGVVTIGGFIYWFTNGNNPESMKFIIESLKDLNIQLGKTFSSETKLVNTNIFNLMQKLEDINLDITNIKNTIALLKRN